MNIFNFNQKINPVSNFLLCKKSPLGSNSYFIISQNKYTIFPYAGLFYKDIRNPKVLLEYLVKKNSDFRFIIYTNLNHPENMEILENYIDKVGDKLIINSIVPREECIYELSKANFLIYQNNFNEKVFRSYVMNKYFTK